MNAIYQSISVFLFSALLVSCQSTPTSHHNSSSSQNQYNNPPAIISFSTESGFILPGTPYTLNWQTHNAATVHISEIGPVAPSGSHQINNSEPTKNNIVLTASTPGFPSVTKIIPVNMVVFSTKAPSGIPLNTPVMILADQQKLRHYKSIYAFRPVNKFNLSGNLKPYSKPKPIPKPHKPLQTTKFTPAYSMITPLLAAPKQLSPANLSKFRHYPRTLNFRWQAVANAKSYNLEIDCLHCCAKGKWCTDIGKQHKRLKGLSKTTFQHRFVGKQPGRWRVQAVAQNGKAGNFSPWYNFVFTR